ncbi:MAG TPA: hypothetical protein VFM18_04690 [Methanosarcina sp.]|nr:hypothetical protein [Methanosarcina sp.]
MSNVQINITETNDFAAPSGTVFKGYTYQLVLADVVYKTALSDLLSFTFTEVTPATYEVKVFATDSSDQPIGNILTGQAIVPEPVVSVKTPSTITVVVS